MSKGRLLGFGIVLAVLLFAAGTAVPLLDGEVSMPATTSPPQTQVPSEIPANVTVITATGNRTISCREMIYDYHSAQSSLARATTAVSIANIRKYLSDNSLTYLKCSVTPLPSSGAQAVTTTAIPSQSGPIPITIPVITGSERAGCEGLLAGFTSTKHALEEASLSGNSNFTRTLQARLSALAIEYNRCVFPSGAGTPPTTLPPGVNGTSPPKSPALLRGNAAIAAAANAIQQVGKVQCGEARGVAARIEFYTKLLNPQNETLRRSGNHTPESIGEKLAQLRETYRKATETCLKQEGNFSEEPCSRLAEIEARLALAKNFSAAAGEGELTRLRERYMEALGNCKQREGIKETILRIKGNVTELTDAEGVSAQVRANLTSDGIGLKLANGKAVKIAPSGVGIVAGFAAQNMTLEERGVYVVRAVEKRKLFGFIPVEVERESEVDAEDGNVTIVKRPFWLFLTTPVPV